MILELVVPTEPLALHCGDNKENTTMLMNGNNLSFTQGTTSSKKKKQAKLKRVMATVKKQAKKDAANPHDSFAAVQLLNDPQVHRRP